MDFIDAAYTAALGVNCFISWTDPDDEVFDIEADILVNGESVVSYRPFKSTGTKRDGIVALAYQISSGDTIQCAGRVYDGTNWSEEAVSDVINL